MGAKDQKHAKQASWSLWPDIPGYIAGGWMANVKHSELYSLQAEHILGAIDQEHAKLISASEDELEVEALSRITEDTRWKINLFRWLSNSWNILIFKEKSNNQEVLKKVELVKSTKCL